MEDTDGLLFGMELDVDATKAELRAINANNKGFGAGGFLNSMGLGALADQLDDLALGELPYPNFFHTYSIPGVCPCMVLLWGGTLATRHFISLTFNLMVFGMLCAQIWSCEEFWLTVELSQVNCWTHCHPVWMRLWQWQRWCSCPTATNTKISRTSFLTRRRLGTPCGC